MKFVPDKVVVALRVLLHKIIEVIWDAAVET